MLVKIYTDGAARGNPDGPGGYGVVLHYTDSKGQLHEREYSQGYQKTTNNRMELMAVIVGLEALKRPCQVDTIRSTLSLSAALTTTLPPSLPVTSIWSDVPPTTSTVKVVLDSSIRMLDN